MVRRSATRRSPSGSRCYGGRWETMPTVRDTSPPSAAAAIAGCLAPRPRRACRTARQRAPRYVASCPWLATLLVVAALAAPAGRYRLAEHRCRDASRDAVRSRATARAWTYLARHRESDNELAVELFRRARAAQAEPLATAGLSLRLQSACYQVQPFGGLGGGGGGPCPPRGAGTARLRGFSRARARSRRAGAGGPGAGRLSACRAARPGPCRRHRQRGLPAGRPR